MRHDDTVLLIGEEVGCYQGAFKVSKRFVEGVGPQRVVDTPITEAGFTGLAIGAAAADRRTDDHELGHRGARSDRQQRREDSLHVSNLGMFGVDNFIAVLMPPQAASIAVGDIRDVSVVVKGAVTVGRRMKVTLSCDHRALDGLMGAQFLKEFKRILEHPQELIAPMVKP